MDVGRFTTFAKVAETRSFSRAAKALRLRVSSVSRAVARLEAELGAQLFERTTRRTELTAAGRAYYQSVRRALDELADGERRVADLQSDPHGEVRLTVPSDFDEGFLAARLAVFARTHPGIHLTVMVTNRTVDLAAEGLDLAVRVAGRLADSELVARKLGAFHAWLVASTEYLARRGAPARPADLAQHDCIIGPSADGSAQWVLRGPRGAESVTVRGPIAADSMAFMRRLVLGGAGIGVLPHAPRSAAIADGRLVRVLPEHVMPGPGLYLVSRAARRLPARVALLRAFLIDAYGAAS